MKRFFVPLLMCLTLRLAALDFGLTLNQTAEYGNDAWLKPEGTAGYAGSYSPWLFASLTDEAALYLSAKLGMKYEAEEWQYKSSRLLFELGRFEVSWRPASSVFLEMGRLRFQDTSGFIAAGLFDGVKGGLTLGKVRLDASALYTGFSCKESTKIILTPGDSERYALPLNYSSPDNYFASRRFLLSAVAELRDLTPRTSLILNGLAQFDLNPQSIAGESALHSQYLTAQFVAAPLSALNITASAVAGLMQNQEGKNFAQFAAAAALDWNVPGAVQDMLQGEFQWAGGMVNNENISSFRPITSIPQGQIFTPSLSALITIKGKYTAHLLQNFSASLEGTYFIRTDGETLVGTEYPPSASRLLGGELYGSALWALFSDFILTLGGGVFFPQWGNTFDSDAPVRWKVSAGIIFSI